VQTPKNGGVSNFLHPSEIWNSELFSEPVVEMIPFQLFLAIWIRHSMVYIDFCRWLFGLRVHIASLRQWPRRSQPLVRIETVPGIVIELLSWIWIGMTQGGE
jgi:hypothetical protein